MCTQTRERGGKIIREREREKRDGKGVGETKNLSSQDHGLMAHWVTNIRNVSRLHQEELSKIEDHEAKVRRLVELNVIEQCLNISKIGFIQKMQKKTASENKFPLFPFPFSPFPFPLFPPYPPSLLRYPTPRVHGVVYDPAEGLLKKLDLDEAWRKQKESLSPIFDLYE